MRDYAYPLVIIHHSTFRIASVMQVLSKNILVVSYNYFVFIKDTDIYFVNAIKMYHRTLCISTLALLFRMNVSYLRDMI